MNKYKLWEMKLEDLKKLMDKIYLERGLNIDFLVVQRIYSARLPLVKKVSSV